MIEDIAQMREEVISAAKHGGEHLTPGKGRITDAVAIPPIKRTPAVHIRGSAARRLA